MRLSRGWHSSTCARPTWPFKRRNSSPVQASQTHTVSSVRAASICHALQPPFQSPFEVQKCKDRAASCLAMHGLEDKNTFAMSTDDEGGGRALQTSSSMSIGRYRRAASHFQVVMGPGNLVDGVCGRGPPASARDGRGCIVHRAGQHQACRPHTAHSLALAWSPPDLHSHRTAASMNACPGRLQTHNKFFTMDCSLKKTLYGTCSATVHINT
jgi:hypothetical protein